MAWDLEAVLRAASGSDGDACLVKLGTAIRPGGRESVGFSDASGRLLATVRDGLVELTRRLGRRSCGKHSKRLIVSLKELDSLAIGIETWIAEREDWAGFLSRAVGCPPYVGHVFEYQPPGLGSERVRVGRRGPVPAANEGNTFVGNEEVVPLAEPRLSSGGLRVIAEIWRRGENCGPPEGVVVGLQYELGTDLVLGAWRDTARAFRADGSDLCIEIDDLAFVRTLGEYLCSARPAGAAS